MTLEDVQWPDTPFSLLPHAHIIARRGSEAHGLYVPPSEPTGIDDRDLIVAVIPPPEFYIGLSRWEHAESIKGCWDVVAYEWRKLVGLLTKQNPNVLSLLWLHDDDYLYVSPIGRSLLESRALFRHRAYAYKSFLGYADSQLKKMTSGAYRGYMGEKRKALVDRYGFDTKNAAHLVRLLHMGAEYLREGVLYVRRTWDLEMLLDIKRGGWSLEQVQRYAIDRFGEFDDAINVSPLPDEIDEARVTAFLVETIRRAWEEP